MPNRVIKDSLLVSEKVSSLTDFEFRLWVSMILLVDDAGRGDARPAIIKGRAFPLRERVSLKDIEVAVHGLAAKGCVSLYEVGGKPYFWFPTWSNHQRVRDVKPKYPAPDGFDGLPQSAASCGELPPESESNTNISSSPKSPTKKVFDAESKPMKCAVYLDACILDRLPTKKPASEPTLQTWADAFDKLNRIDGQDWELIAEVLEFSQTDDFWSRNILSGDKFRKQFFTLLSKARG